MTAGGIGVAAPRASIALDDANTRIVTNKSFIGRPYARYAGRIIGKLELPVAP